MYCKNGIAAYKQNPIFGSCGSYDRAMQKKQYLVDHFGFDETLIHIHPSDILLAHGLGDSYSSSCRGYGAKVLGTWVGHSDYIKSSLQGKLMELQQEKDAIIRFKDPQVRNLMFRWCFCTKINHLLRTTSPSIIEEFIIGFDEMKKDILHSFFSSKYSREEIPGKLWSQAQLHIRDGGLGLQYTCDVSRAAYLASMLDCKESLVPICANLQNLLDGLHVGGNDLAQPLFQELGEALFYIGDHQLIPSLLSIPLVLQMKDSRGSVDDQEAEEDMSTSSKTFQEILSRLMRQARTASFKTSISTNSKELAWYVSLADSKNGNPGRWLECCPKSPSLEFTPRQFIALMFYRFFLPSPCIIAGTRCSCKNSPILDAHGVHLTTACGKDGFRHRTHDTVIHAIATMTRSCGIMTKKEEFRCFQEADPNSDKRPDLSFANAPGRNRKLVTDLRITCPYPCGPTSVLSVAAANREGRAANQAFAAKMRVYEDLSRQNNLEFLPMIIESTGRMHPQLIKFIDSVLMEKSQGDSVLRGKLRRYWFSHISCSVQRALAESLILRSTRVNGAITSSMAGDWSLSDAFIERFTYKNIH